MDKPTTIDQQTWDELMEQYEGAILFTGFEEALVGFGYQHSNPVAIYDRQRCIEILMEDLLPEETAEEDAWDHFNFNVIGSYVGESTPIFITYENTKDTKP